MSLRLARKLERVCCTFARYLPLAFVYGLTSWACWVIVAIGRETTRSSWIGTTSSAVGIVLYVMLNWCYTTAVFTDPGSTTNTDGYGLLPTDNENAARVATSLTVKSNGAMRFCKKCQARKPDRAHHCSTCRRCVLKMDHHCPWLANCIGLRNYKAFLLFLLYTTAFCFYSFAVSGCWFWAEMMTDARYLDTLLPVNFIMLAVMSGIIGLVVGAFTTWHVVLSCRGQTTIESLEKTRYLSTVRRTLYHAQQAASGMAGMTRQLVDFARPEGDHHDQAATAAALVEAGGAAVAPRVQLSYAELERQQARKRYEEYLDEQDSDKLPSAFDLGWRKNVLHLLGPNPVLWALPVCTTTGDGWRWEPSPKWLAERERLQSERERQRMREVNAGWGFGTETDLPSTTADATGNYHSRSPLHAGNGRRFPSKADRILGRDPNLYADVSQDVPMRRLSPRGRTLDEELESSDEEEGDDEGDDEGVKFSPSAGERLRGRAEVEKRALNLVTNGRGWGRGGASGVLRQPSPPTSASGSSRMTSPGQSDDDVD